MELLINAALLTLLAVVTVGIARQRNLFGAIILFGVYSFLMASLMIALDAIDVAMTEASVGAGVSTVFLLAALHLTKSLEQKSAHTAVMPLLLSLAVGAMLVWGTLGLAPFGSPDSPMHKVVSPTYLADSYKVMAVPNVVTAVLANYRSFDTLGEVAVIFTGGMAVMLLLKGRALRRRSALDTDQTGRGADGVADALPGAARKPDPEGTA